MTRHGITGTFLALALAVLPGCSGRVGSGAAPTPSPDVENRDSAPVFITLLQFNDVYEITPMAGGLWGGPARVATLRKSALERNPNTLTVLAGDFLSPSALSTARLDGERLDGRQMVAVLNAIGVDYVTFGNHEFDLGETAFFERLDEIRFPILSINVTSADGAALPGVRPHQILVFGNERGDSVRLALFGVTMDRDQADYAPIAPPIGPAIAHARTLRDSADILVALTHLPLGQDIALAEAVPEIDLILGGHEHENIEIRRGPDLTPIAKADANFRTVFLHELRWDPSTGRTSIRSRLVEITDSLPRDPGVRAIAEEWVQTAYNGFRAGGFQPESTVVTLPVAFDGRESVVYQETTALTTAIADAMLEEVDGTDAAIFNAGSIRIDDVLPPGPITEYDVIRVLPFGGPVVEVEMTGALLRQVLDQGLQNRGTGGFLQHARIVRNNQRWLIADREIDDSRTYRLAVSDFLISGREQGLDFLNRDNPDLTVIAEHRDIRFVLMDALRSR